MDYLELTKSIILKYIDSSQYQVFLFGSRACGKSKYASDIDVGVLGNHPLSNIIKSEIEHEIEESMVPFKVEIVDFSEVDENFKEKALQTILKWN